MKYFTISVAVCMLPLTAYGQVNQFVFIAESEIPQGELVQITLQAQNSAGEAEAVGSTTCLSITTNSPGGELFANETSDPESPLILTMNSNWKNRNFYYKDTHSGSYEIQVSIALKPDDRTCSDWPRDEWDEAWSATHTFSLGGDTEDVEETDSQEPRESHSSSSSSSNEAEVQKVLSPLLEAHAGPDRRIFIGTEVRFNGSATNEYGEEEDGIIYQWNFGDGTTASGRSVVHTYRTAGTYVAALFVDEQYMNMQDTDEATISVIDPDIEITEVSFVDGTVRIRNDSDMNADLSGWGVAVAGTRFMLPDRTHLLAGASITLALSDTPLRRGNVALLLPSGQYAGVHTDEKTSPSPVSVQPAVHREVPQQTTQVEESQEEMVYTEAPARTYAAAGSSEKTDSPIIGWLVAVLALGLVGGISVVAVRREQNSI